MFHRIAGALILGSLLFLGASARQAPNVSACVTCTILQSGKQVIWTCPETSAGGNACQISNNGQNCQNLGLCSE
jgi:hypothetical protein